MECETDSPAEADAVGEAEDSPSNDGAAPGLAKEAKSSKFILTYVLLLTGLMSYLAYRSPRHLDVVGIALLTLSAIAAAPDLLAAVLPKLALSSKDEKTEGAGKVARAFSWSVALMSRWQWLVLVVFLLGTVLVVVGVGNAVETINTARTLELLFPGFTLLWISAVAMVAVAWVERRVDTRKPDEVRSYVESGVRRFKAGVPLLLASVLFLSGTFVQIVATFHDSSGAATTTHTRKPTKVVKTKAKSTSAAITTARVSLCAASRRRFLAF